MSEELSGCLFYVALGVILLFLYLTWPVGILFAVSGGLWLASRRSERLWVQAIAYVFSAVTIGLGILCFALFVLNAFKSTFDPDWVRSVEESLYVLLLYLRTINPSGITAILILLALTIVTYYLPHWKLLDKYLWVKKSLSKTIIVLATVTSFTFFGQLPMNEWALQAHDKVVTRYRAALRQEWQSQGQYLSANALEKHVRGLDEPRRAYFRVVYSTIKSEAFRDGTDYTAAVSEHMADLQSTKTEEFLRLTGELDQKPAAKEVKLAEEELIERMPQTAGERGKQLKILAEQEVRAKAAEARAGEALKGLKKVFAEVVTSQLPGVDGVSGFYLKKLVANYSEHFFEKSVEQFHRKAAQTGVKAPILAAEMVQAITPEPQLAKQLLEPRLGSNVTELSAVGLAAAAPLLRTQVAQEVQRVTRMEANKAINNEIARRAAIAHPPRTSTGGSSGSYRPSTRRSGPRIRPRGR